MAGPPDAGAQLPEGAGPVASPAPRNRSSAHAGPARVTHLDRDGSARMVDVGSKQPTRRVAKAEALVQMSPETAATVLAGNAPKGDVISTARIAGIQAAKRTDELIPLAHTLTLTNVDLTIDIDPSTGVARIESEASTLGPTGVEMEAMTACAVAALTLYDMVKGLQRGVSLERIQLLEKTGGRHDWRRNS